jgi:hypothetical protein
VCVDRKSILAFQFIHTGMTKVNIYKDLHRKGIFKTVTETKKLLDCFWRPKHFKCEWRTVYKLRILFKESNRVHESKLSRTWMTTSWHLHWISWVKDPPRESNSCLASQYTSTLRHPLIQYLTHKSSLLVPVHKQMNQFHDIQSNFFYIKSLMFPTMYD